MFGLGALILRDCLRGGSLGHSSAWIVALCMLAQSEFARWYFNCCSLHRSLLRLLCWGFCWIPRCVARLPFELHVRCPRRHARRAHCGYGCRYLCRALVLCLLPPWLQMTHSTVAVLLSHQPVESLRGKHQKYARSGDHHAGYDSRLPALSIRHSKTRRSMGFKEMK